MKDSDAVLDSDARRADDTEGDAYMCVGLRVRVRVRVRACVRACVHVLACMCVCVCVWQMDTVGDAYVVAGLLPQEEDGDEVRTFVSIHYIQYKVRTVYNTYMEGC